MLITVAQGMGLLPCLQRRASRQESRGSEAGEEGLRSVVTEGRFNFLGSHEPFWHKIQKCHNHHLTLLQENILSKGWTDQEQVRWNLLLHCVW